MLSKSLDCPTKLGGRAKRRGYYYSECHTTSPSSRGKPSALLKGDKSPAVVTDAIIPRRPPILGEES